MRKGSVELVNVLCMCMYFHVIGLRINLNHRIRSKYDHKMWSCILQSLFDVITIIMNLMKSNINLWKIYKMKLTDE